MKNTDRLEKEEMSKLKGGEEVTCTPNGTRMDADVSDEVTCTPNGNKIDYGEVSICEN